MIVQFLVQGSKLGEKNATVHEPRDLAPRGGEQEEGYEGGGGSRRGEKWRRAFHASIRREHHLDSGLQRQPLEVPVFHPQAVERVQHHQ